MMRHFYTISFLFLALLSFGQPVPISEVEPVVQRFMQSRSGFSHHSAAVVDDITPFNSIAGIPIWYIVNFKTAGWVIVSARYECFPILAYSFKGRYTSKNQPEALKAWMQQYSEAIGHLIANPDKGLARNELWNDTNLFSKHQRDINPVEPFINSSWDQGWPYNENCPIDEASSDGHCPTGCVPTAMAQIMYYYRWPVNGVGSYSYDAGNYGILSADFGATTYNWNSMGTSLKHASPSAATLLSHLGISCDLVYGPNGSGMYNHKAAYSLRTYFKYSPQTAYVFRDSTNLQWDSLLMAHLDRRMPLYYAGWSVPNVNGHAFVCDGYQDSAFFHFNFGWNGSYDGYFNINELYVGGNNFNLSQEVIINCYPDSVNYSYPLQCQGDEVMTSFEGSGSDGSAPIGNYQAGAACSWLINPQTEVDSVSSIVLMFHQFETGNAADVVNVYDGSTVDAPLIASFSGLQEPLTIESTQNAMLITFRADGTTPGKGFDFSYESKLPVWCSGSKTLTDLNGNLTDGSGRFSYYDGTRCIWKIQPPDVGTLTLFFDAFNTVDENDYLRVLDLGTGDLLGEYSGSYPLAEPPAPLVATGGKMMILFSANGSARGDGFSAHWESNVAVDDGLAGRVPLTVIPNPANGQMEMIHSFQSGVAVVEIWGMTGQLVSRQSINLNEGVRCRFENVSMQPGSYLLVLSQGDQKSRTRFVRY